MTIETGKSYDLEVGRLLLQVKTKNPSTNDVLAIDASNIGGNKPSLQLNMAYSGKYSHGRHIEIGTGCNNEPQPTLPTTPGVWTLDPKDKINYKVSFNDSMLFTYKTQSSCYLRHLTGIIRKITFKTGHNPDTLITAFRTPGMSYFVTFPKTLSLPDNHLAVHEEWDTKAINRFGSTHN